MLGSACTIVARGPAVPLPIRQTVRLIERDIIFARLAKPTLHIDRNL
jgi:hypothetical protein